MKLYLFILIPLTFACNQSDSISSAENLQSDLLNILSDSLPKCPKNHTDSIIPIAYGYPSEEMFAQQDSGLIVLGGCELGDEKYWCKIHEISF